MLTHARNLDVSGVATRCFEAGAGARQLLLVSGGTRSGLFRPSALAWEFNFPALAERFHTVAVDTPQQQLTIDQLVQHLTALLPAANLQRPHLVGHDEGGLAALLLAIKRPELVASLTVVASCAAPAGDAVPNLTLADAPWPLLSPLSQQWALERSSYCPVHVTRGNYLAEAVRLAAEAQPQDAQAYAAGQRASVGRARQEVFALLREQGVAVPTLLLWGLQDPLVPLENALALHRLVQPRQRQAHLCVINRAGNLPFREQPEAFNGAVASFIEALPATSST